MTDLRSKTIRLAYARPELRPYLLPLLRTAMEHSSPEALKNYLKDHPNADPKNHTVSKGKGDQGGSKPLPNKMKGLSSNSQKEMDSWLKPNAKNYSPKDFVGKKTKEKDGGATLTPPKVMEDWSLSDRSEDSWGAIEEWAASQMGMSRSEMNDKFDVESSDFGEPIRLRPKNL